jgi:predicted enzyme related to lactoylglutathione lyase
VRVLQTLCIVGVADMDRATKFYTDAFGATVKFASPFWTSIEVAGVEIGLHGGASGEHRESGLGFTVDDIDAACRAVEAAGGSIVTPPATRPDEGGVTLASIADTEGNQVSLSQAGVR